MKKLKEHHRIERKASHTALIGAIHRFMATKDHRLDDRGADSLAYIFIPLRVRFILSFSFFRKVFHKKSDKKVPGSYAYITARTRFFDEVFVAAAEEKIPQIILLGAGYDTRAIRFQHLAKDSTIYELDVPSTQNEKIRRLKKNKVSLPENIVFVPVNFNTGDLKMGLLSHGYDPEKKTVFFWEGVTMYLNPETVKATLLFIREHSGTDSRIAFDYFYRSVIRETNASFGAKELRNLVGKWGEKFSFGIEEGNVGEFLKSNGFLLLKHYTPSEFEKKYLKMDNSNSRGRMYGFAGHVIAKRKDN